MSVQDTALIHTGLRTSISLSTETIPPFLTQLQISGVYHSSEQLHIRSLLVAPSPLLTIYEDTDDIMILQELCAEHLCTLLSMKLQDKEGGLMESTAQEWCWEGTGRHLVFHLLHLRCKVCR